MPQCPSCNGTGRGMFGGNCSGCQGQGQLNQTMQWIWAIMLLAVLAVGFYVVLS